MSLGREQDINSDQGVREGQIERARDGNRATGGEGGEQSMVSCMSLPSNKPLTNGQLWLGRR